jgi:predicted house-cleaning noncanonical NTP pyrophosphatase (MazG superfamily)
VSKLVRDKIPQIIGQSARFHVAEDPEYLKALAAKLLEEAAEFQQDPSVEELSDVIEVVAAISRAYGWPMMQVTQVRMAKAEKRGKFDARYILEDPV